MKYMNEHTATTTAIRAFESDTSLYGASLIPKFTYKYITHNTLIIDTTTANNVSSPH